MKKIISILFSSILFFSFSLNAFASSNASLYSDSNHLERLNKIEQIYGVPMYVLESLDEETLNIFYTEVNTEDVISKTSYVKFTEDSNGQITTQSFNEAEYLNEIALEKITLEDNPQTLAENSWMKIKLTLLSRSDTVGEVSGHFTWLTRPTFRLHDVVGLVVQNGTAIKDSAAGFYTYQTSQGTVNNTWTSGFKYFIGGVTKTQTLAKPDYPVTSDNMFLKFQVHKNGAEGLFGTYGHQQLSISVSSPSFELVRTSGKLKPINFTLGKSYDEFTDYQDTNASWSK